MKAFLFIAGFWLGLLVAKMISNGVIPGWSF